MGAHYSGLPPIQLPGFCVEPGGLAVFQGGFPVYKSQGIKSKSKPATSATSSASEFVYPSVVEN